MMQDLISRQQAIDAICNACGKIDCDKMDKCEKLQLPPANCSEFPNNSDTISRQAAIDAIKKHYRAHDNDLLELIAFDIEQLPPIQPEITHEQAVAYLQSTGWMQEHDRQMMLDGVHRLTAQPEIVRCKDCKYAEYIDDVQTLWCTECGQGRTVAPQ